MAVTLLCVFGLCACASTPPVTAPAQIPPPPATATSECPTPQQMPQPATAADLVDAVLGWMHAFGCEHGKRVELLDAWPH